MTLSFTRHPSAPGRLTQFRHPSEGWDLPFEPQNPPHKDPSLRWGDDLRVFRLHL